MSDYRPALSPSDPLYGEFANLQKAGASSQSRAALQYLAVLPTRPQDGLYLFAATVAGANRGLYRYDASTAAYTFIA